MKEKKFAEIKKIIVEAKNSTEGLEDKVEGGKTKRNKMGTRR